MLSLADGDFGVSDAKDDSLTDIDTARTIQEDGRYVFKLEDFGLTDTSGASAKAVRVDDAPKSGVLLLDGSTVVAGQVITVSDIELGRLVWETPANLNGTALGALLFSVGDFSGPILLPETELSTGKITFDVTEVNDEPAPRIVSGSTYENAVFTIQVDDAVIDVDNDELTMINAKILSGFGSVMINTKKVLIYNPMVGPNQNLGLGDSREVVIGYTVSDGKGGTTTATITLTIKGVSQDIFSGTSGNDRLEGSIHGDLMYGKAGTDIVVGGAGDDLLDGGNGSDKLMGEGGNDTYVLDCASDVVLETVNGGTDTVQAACNYTLTANVEKLTLLGTAATNGTGNGTANTIIGNGGANKLLGLAGNDALKGGKGADRIEGGVGNDSIEGGAGADCLSGGSGRDTFVFRSVSESTVSSTGRDWILDFSRNSGDRIDLRGIDAREATKVDDGFAFIGKSAFTKHAGELRYQRSGSDTLVLGDTDGDGKADFSFLVSGNVGFANGDFLL